MECSSSISSSSSSSSSSSRGSSSSSSSSSRSGSCGCLSTLSIYLSIYLSFLFIYLSVCLFVCLSVYLQAWKAKLFCETSSIFELDNIKKRSNSARLPQFLHLTTSKTQQFCETSSCFYVDNIKNEAILRDVLPKWKVECRADGLVPMRFAVFPLHLSKVLRMPRKCDAIVMPCHTKCGACHAKSSSKNWRCDVPKCNPTS